MIFQKQIVMNYTRRFEIKLIVVKIKQMCYVMYTLYCIHHERVS